MKMIDLEPRAGDAAELLTAMANRKRLLILCHLLDAELSVGELSERVELAQSPLSQHLSKLRALRLVSARRDGQSIRYRLASGDVGRLLRTLYGIYCTIGHGHAEPSGRERKEKRTSKSMPFSRAEEPEGVALARQIAAIDHRQIDLRQTPSPPTADTIR